MPATMEISVVLPDPLSPTRKFNSPARRSTVMSCSTLILPVADRKVLADARRFRDRRAHRNTSAGSVFKTERSASQPVSRIITTTTTAVMTGICHGM